MPKGLTDEEMGLSDSDMGISDEEMGIKNQESGGFLEDTGKWILGRVGDASTFLDKYSMAPLRAAALEKSQGKSWSDAAKAYQANVGNEDAPSYYDLARAYEASDEDSIPTPAITDFLQRPIDSWSDPDVPKTSAAKLLGLGGSVAGDPLNAAVPFGGKIAGKIAKKTLSAPKKMAGGFKNLAEEQAVKAGLGQNKAAFRRMANVPPEGLPDPDIVMGNIRKGGRVLLDTKSVPRFSSTEGVGRKAAENFKKVGSEIGSIGKTVDTARPTGSVSGKDVADKVIQYAAKMPPTEANKILQERLLREAANFENAGMMTFDDATKWKGQFSYKPGSSDLVENSSSISRVIKQAFTDAMDDAVNAADSSGDLSKSYKQARSKYGPLKTTAQSSSIRQIGDLSNRFVSPSDYAAGGIGALDAAIEGAGMIGTGAKGGLVAGINRLARNYGSAFVARGADDVYKAMKTIPNLEKYAPVFEKAARLGERGVMAYHQLLMNKDSEYKKAFLAGETQVTKEPFQTAGTALDMMGLGKFGMAGIVMPLALMKPGKLIEGLVQLFKQNPEEDISKLKNVWMNTVKNANPELPEDNISVLFDGIKNIISKKGMREVEERLSRMKYQTPLQSNTSQIREGMDRVYEMQRITGNKELGKIVKSGDMQSAIEKLLAINNNKFPVSELEYPFIQLMKDSGSDLAPERIANYFRNITKWSTGQ